MNLIKRYSIVAICACLIVSCTTTEKFAIYGIPGTEIYSPEKKSLGTISSKGKLDIKVPSDSYYGYLYTYDNALNDYVPFALETKTKRHNGTKISYYTGMGLTAVGVGTTVIGIIPFLLASDDEDAQQTFGFVTAGGAAVAGVGAALGGPAGGRMGQLSYQYNFGYQKKQFTNADLTFEAYKPPVNEVATETRPKRSKAVTTQESSDKSTSSKSSQKTSKASRSRKDPAKQVEGSYIGTGALIVNKKTEESIDNILVKITFVKNGVVKVEIFEDGELFFESEELYDVTTTKGSSYSLKHQAIKSATITIDSKGALKYKNPNVNIDGDIYTFDITAKLQE
ncbi:MAG: hypothetical protein J1E63_08415 [Muribaculaceae bacterium]|nr:hypothetical protein [Muribaculaceae bacterium]